MLKCFVSVCNRSHASSTWTRPTSTRIGWRVKKKIKMLFTGLGRSVFGETVPSVWVSPSAYGLGWYSRPRAQLLPIRTSQPVYNIYIHICHGNSENSDGCSYFLRICFIYGTNLSMSRSWIPLQVADREEGAFWYKKTSANQNIVHLKTCFI